MIRSGNYGGTLLTKASTQTALFRKKDRTSPRPLPVGYAPTTGDRSYKTFLWLRIPRCNPRQQKFRAMNGANLASPIKGELGYAHWPQLGTQFIALLGTKFGAH